MTNFLTYYWPLLAAGILLALFVVELKRYQQAKRRLQSLEQAPLPDEQLILVRVNSHISVRDRNIIAAMMILFLLLFLLLPAFVVLNKYPDSSLSEMFSQYLDFISKERDKFLKVVVIGVFIPVLIFYLQRVLAKEKLVLDKSGIAYFPPAGWLFRFFNPAWHLKWSEIASVRLNHHLARGQVVITPRIGKPRYLMAPVWRQLDQTDIENKSIFMRIRHQHAMQTDPEVMLGLPLLRYMHEIAGIEINIKDSGLLGFDLMKNAHTRSAVVLLFTILGYAIFDYLLLSERYVHTPTPWWFICGGMLVTFSAGVWLAKPNVPRSSAWGLAMLIGVITAIGLYPGLLRINQLTDSTGLIQYEYRHVEPSRFEPLQEGLPAIIMESSEYWRSVGYDEPVVFSLRRGSLGFYQINMEAEYKKMRHWYCVKRAGTNTEKRRACMGI